MRTKMRVAMCVLPAPLLVAGLIYLNIWPVSSPANASQQVVEIPQPDAWVPFDADFRTTENGNPDMIGRYYRSADGSFREEQQTIDGTLKLVSISNIPTATAYLFNSRRGETWVQKPMLLSPDGFKPLRYRQGTRNLTAHIERVEGFDVYKYVDANGAVNLQAPALNFFGLVTERPRGDRLERRVYYNVHVREQAREFFEPPSGVAMEYDSRPIPNGVRVSTPQPAQ